MGLSARADEQMTDEDKASVASLQQGKLDSIEREHGEAYISVIRLS
jgi:hypothetical protein